MAVCEQVATLFICYRKSSHKYFCNVPFAKLSARDGALAPWTLPVSLVLSTFPYIPVRVSPHVICPEFLFLHTGKYLSF